MEICFLRKFLVSKNILKNITILEHTYTVISYYIKAKVNG